MELLMMPIGRSSVFEEVGEGLVPAPVPTGGGMLEERDRMWRSDPLSFRKYVGDCRTLCRLGRGEVLRWKSSRWRSSQERWTARTLRFSPSMKRWRASNVGAVNWEDSPGAWFGTRGQSRHELNAGVRVSCPQARVGRHFRRARAAEAEMEFLMQPIRIGWGKSRPARNAREWDRADGCRGDRGRECGADGCGEGQIPTSIGILHGEDESTCPWMELEIEDWMELLNLVEPCVHGASLLGIMYVIM